MPSQQFYLVKVETNVLIAIMLSFALLFKQTNRLKTVQLHPVCVQPHLPEPSMSLFHSQLLYLRTMCTLLDCAITPECPKLGQTAS